MKNAYASVAAKILPVIFLLIFVLTLTACGANLSENRDSPVESKPYYFEVDGRTLTCIVVKDEDSLGLSCDWVSYNEYGGYSR